MGGSINVFLRDNERNLHKMTRWTNSLPWFLDCIGHMEDEKTHLDEYLEEWLAMKDDWLENGSSGRFKYNMTPVYFPSPRRFCRSEYGIVFVDYITKTIISEQYYTSIGQLTVPAVSLHYNTDEEREFLEKIVQKGKMRYRSFKDYENIQPIKDVKHFTKLVKSRDFNTEFLIDNSPWSVINFEEGTKFGIIKERIDDFLAQ